MFLTCVSDGCLPLKGKLEICIDFRSTFYKDLVGVCVLKSRFTPNAIQKYSHGYK